MGPLKHKIDPFFSNREDASKYLEQRAVLTLMLPSSRQALETWVSAVAGWKSLAMWFTLHHNQITLPGIPPAKPTIQYPVCEDRSWGGRRYNWKKKRCKSWWRREGCRWGQREKGKKGTDCRCLSEYTSARQSRFTPSSLCHYGTHF